MAKNLKAAVEKAVTHYLRQGIPFEEITPEAVNDYLRAHLGITDDDFTADIGFSAEDMHKVYEQAVILWRIRKLGLPSVKEDTDSPVSEMTHLLMEGFERDRLDEDPDRKEGIAKLDAQLVRLYRARGWIDNSDQ